MRPNASASPRATLPRGELKPTGVRPNAVLSSGSITLGAERIAYSTK